MNIVVCIKQVPDTNEVKIDPVTNNLVREGIPSIMNPYDKNAVEEALKIKDVLPCTVIAVSMGPGQAAIVLQEALDMGVDRAVLLSDRAFAGSDTLATGYALSELVKTFDPGLVLCGAEAIDGSTGQVGPSIAENLGLPQITCVHKIERVSETEVEANREVKEAYERLACSLPALLCVLRGINEPRIGKPCKNRPEIINAESLGLDPGRLGINGSPTRVEKIDVSGRKAAGFVFIDSSLTADERIELIVNGGMRPKKINLTRGTSDSLAEIIFNDEVFSSHLQN